MILTVLHTVLEWRHLPAAVVIIGSSPLYTASWTVLKVLTAPFGQKYFHKAEDCLYSCYQWSESFFFEKYSGVEFVFYGDPLPDKNENVLYLSNHQSTVDWVLAEHLALRAGAGGTVRYILKDVLKYIPLYGYFLYKHGCVYIRRRGSDQEQIEKQLKHLVEQNRPIWLCLFAEGTRYTPSKARQSRMFAASRTLPQYQHVLLPKTRGFEVSLDALSDYLNAVYDITILYEGSGQEGRMQTPPHLFNFFSGRWKKVHIHVHRTEISNIPKTSSGRKQWLYDRFQEKDSWLDNLKKDSTSVHTPREIPLPLTHNGGMALLASCGCLLLWWKWPRRVLLASASFYAVYGVLAGVLGL